jgi:hypothetical protein
MKKRKRKHFTRMWEKEAIKRKKRKEHNIRKLEKKEERNI